MCEWLTEKNAIDLNKLSQYWIQHLLFGIYKFSHDVKSLFIGKIESILFQCQIFICGLQFDLNHVLLISSSVCWLELFSLQKVDFLFDLGQFVFHLVPQDEFLLYDIVFVVPEFIVFIEGLHLLLKICNNILFFQMTLCNIRSIMKLHMILREKLFVHIFLFIITTS
jgi:hypothetical protein